MLGTAVDSGDAMLNKQVAMEPYAGRNGGGLKWSGRKRGFLGELVKKIWKSTDKISRHNMDDDLPKSQKIQKL